MREVRVGSPPFCCIAQLGAKAWCDTCHMTHDMTQNVPNALSIDGRGGYLPRGFADGQGRKWLFPPCPQMEMGPKHPRQRSMHESNTGIYHRHSSPGGVLPTSGRPGTSGCGRRCKEVHDSNHRANLYKRLRNERRTPCSLRLSRETMLFAYNKKNNPCTPWKVTPVPLLDI